jgi:hypothetical protein
MQGKGGTRMWLAKNRRSCEPTSLPPSAQAGGGAVPRKRWARAAQLIPHGKLGIIIASPDICHQEVPLIRRYGGPHPHPDANIYPCGVLLLIQSTSIPFSRNKSALTTSQTKRLPTSRYAQSQPSNMGMDLFLGRIWVWTVAWKSVVYIE